MIVSQRRRVYVDEAGRTEKIDVLQSMRKLDVPGSNIFALCCEHDRKEVDKSSQKSMKGRMALIIFVAVLALLTISVAVNGLSLAVQADLKHGANSVVQLKEYLKVNYNIKLQNQEDEQNSNIEFHSLEGFLKYHEQKGQKNNVGQQILKNLHCKIIGGDIFCKISAKMHES